MADDVVVDPEALRERVRDKYREVAVDPHRSFHFQTGRRLAARARLRRSGGRGAPGPGR